MHCVWSQRVQILHVPSPCKQIALTPSCPQKYIAFLTSSRCSPGSQVARSIPGSGKWKLHSTHGWRRNLADPPRWCVFAAPVYRSIHSESCCCQEVYQSDNSLAASVTYPLASYQQLRGIIDYMAAGFLLDDLLHVSFCRSFHMGSRNLHSDRSSREVAPALSQLWMNTLRDGSEAKSVQHPVIEMMRRLVDPFAPCLVSVKSFPMQ